MKGSRQKKDEKTLERMIQLYCRKNHHTRDELCLDCSELLQYSLNRFKNCPFGEEKPVCAQCPVHCYNAAKREQIGRVMRFSGPRMIFHYPLDALTHLWRMMHSARSVKKAR